MYCYLYLFGLYNTGIVYIVNINSKLRLQCKFIKLVPQEHALPCRW